MEAKERVKNIFKNGGSFSYQFLLLRRRGEILVVVIESCVESLCDTGVKQSVGKRNLEEKVPRV